ncbi:MAG TPA: ATP-grasp domain-containing protein [Tepidisphaeraceae bacterium]|nr:ATP-grasp domain-containing protein [Tepidisphaeraceae bacterium]
MRKLRVVIMMDELLIPPPDAAGMTADARAPFKTEYDVLAAVRGLGHDVRVVGVKSDLAPLDRELAAFDPHVCFNLVEDFDGVAARDQHVVSYLELGNWPYTGCNPRGLTLARDKALTKKILSYHGVRCPHFAVFPRRRAVRRAPALAFPLLVKSLTEEGSAAIAHASIVHTDKELADRVAFVHEKVGTDAIAEQYVDGRELYVGVIGNVQLQTLPVWELCLDHLPEGAPRIATSKVKWDLDYQKRFDIRSGAAADLPTGAEQYINDLCKEAYRSLGLSGYARMDLRLTADGEVYLIEANANPQITADEDFADSARAAGFDYESLIQRILKLGLSYRPLGLAA